MRRSGNRNEGDKSVTVAIYKLLSQRIKCKVALWQQHSRLKFVVLSYPDTMAYSYPGPKIALDVVKYFALQTDDPEEIRKLVEISQTSGIFFLDLKTGSASGGAYDDMPSVIEAQRKFFSRDAEQKLEYADEHPSRG